MSYSCILRAKISLGAARKRDAFDRLWARPEVRETFTSFLVLLHQIMRASVPLMQHAHARCEMRASTDPLCAALSLYYARHIEEERDHDAWALDDLEAAGLNREFVLSITPSPEAAALSGAQYYWIFHHHPVMLLGYIAVLEGSPPTRDHLDWLQAATRLPDEVFRTFRFHGEVDPHHRDELDETIDALPLSREHMSMISISAFHTLNALADCVENLALIKIPAPDRASSRVV
jgi:hypothetical protein